MSSLETSQVSQWIPLMEYAMKKGVSLSTLRRHIKNNKITFRVEAGKYFLLDDEAPLARPVLTSKPKVGAELDEPKDHTRELQIMVHKLKAELQRTHEEIAELKTLIAFYEERTPQPRLDV